MSKRVEIVEIIGMAPLFGVYKGFVIVFRGGLGVCPIHRV